MYVKPPKTKLIDDVDSFLENLKLLLKAEIGHTKLVDASAAHWKEDTRRRDKRLFLKNADLPFDQVSEASLQSPWRNQMLQAVNISESLSMTNTQQQCLRFQPMVQSAQRGPLT